MYHNCKDFWDCTKDNDLYGFVISHLFSWWTTDSSNSTRISKAELRFLRHCSHPQTCRSICSSSNMKQVSLIVAKSQVHDKRKWRWDVSGYIKLENILKEMAKVETETKNGDGESEDIMAKASGTLEGSGGYQYLCRFNTWDHVYKGMNIIHCSNPTQYSAFRC